MARRSGDSFKIENLGKYPIFKDMTIDQVREVHKFVRPAYYKKNDLIWTEGDYGEDVGLLVEGKIEITQQLTLFTSEDSTQSADKSLIRLTAEQRPVIGEIALCANSPRSATVVAKSTVKMGLFSLKDLRQIIKSDPSFGYLLYRNLASIVAERLIQANQNVLKLTTAFSLAVQRGT